MVDLTLSNPIDWPAWINAITVVFLAAVTVWYAYTTRGMLGELRAERADRLASIRAPYENVLQFTKDVMAVSRLLCVNAEPRGGDSLTPRQELRESVRDRAIEVQPRSARLSRTLYDLHTALQNVDRNQAVVRDRLRAGEDATLARKNLEDQFGKIDAALERLQVEISRYV